MAIPYWIWFIFVFAFGCCIGSFLNVVIYRLPRGESLVSPPSACPACGKYIRFYDNVPLLSWLTLGARCRHCGGRISARYFAIELLTGVVFLSLFVLYFKVGIRLGIGLNNGGWLVYLMHIAMLGAFIAASAIDLERWIIPLSICWFVTIVGFIGCTVGPYVIEVGTISAYKLLPVASADTGALAAGAVVGLGISWLLSVTGALKRSYEPDKSSVTADQAGEQKESEKAERLGDDDIEENYNHRLESLREVLFLLPIIVCAVVAHQIVVKVVSVEARADFALQYPVIAGFLGSIWGYFIGCGIVWAIRIFGTLAFSKEAMGLGDVHLMGAAGAVIGPVPVVVAFFVAPFFGLAWAGCQMFFKKIRQIPYGPFLSIGVVVVIIFHDWIMYRIGIMFGC